jgi:hypothetical protein
MLTGLGRVKAEPERRGERDYECGLIATQVGLQADLIMPDDIRLIRLTRRSLSLLEYLLVRSLQRIQPELPSEGVDASQDSLLLRLPAMFH